MKKKERMKRKMNKYIPHWYDQESEKSVDPPIEANNEEEARKKAYTNHNGNPPAPMLWLEKVG